MQKTMYFQRNWLKVALKRFNYHSIYEFCKDYNIPTCTAYDWNNLKRIPSVTTIIKLCHRLGCTPNDLLLNQQEEFYYV